MTNQEKLKHITDFVHKELLKPLGYKRRRNTFNRKAEEGIIQVINFQSSMYNLESPETTKIKEDILGPQPSYGIFTLNFGVWISEIAENRSDIYGVSTDFITEYKCQIRARIGDFVGKDQWYSLDEDLEKTSTQVLEHVKVHGILFLQGYETRGKILQKLETQPTNITYFSPTPLLVASIIYLHQRNKEKAKELFPEHYDQSESHKPHREYLEGLAKELGLSLNNYS